jgi:phenylalanyl-tRNA synthetase alpha chain
MDFPNLNIPASVLEKTSRKLHLQKNHPISIISKMVIGYFNSLENRSFEVFDDFSPIVTTEANFDRLLIPKNHPARSISDSYYFDEHTLLRTHTSAHQAELIEKQHNSFLAIGDVYRKDEIDRSHYPVFHQIEGVHIFNDILTEKEMSDDLINVLIGLCNTLFLDCPTRVNEDYFPFTNPSFEIEVLYNGEWLEILGCGIIQPKIIESCVHKNKSLFSSDPNNTNVLKKGWAFGIGLDRLAMTLFKIPDIRLLWVTDSKFTSQFNEGSVTEFKSYSTLDPISKDISFWIPDSQTEDKTKYKTEYKTEDKTEGKTEDMTEDMTEDKTEGKTEDMTEDKTEGKTEDKTEDQIDERFYQGYYWNKENDMFDTIRDVAENHHPDIIESVHVFDQFYNSKTQKLSRAYRIVYSVPDPRMNSGATFNDLVNILHKEIGIVLAKRLDVVIR